MSKEVIFLAWSALAGALIPVMAATNGTLGRLIASPLYASLAAALMALAGVALTLLIVRPALPAGAAVAAAPWWSWLGGLAIGFYAISATFVSPRFGVGNFIMCVVVAQLVVSSLIDQFGLFGAAQHAIDAKRGIGLLALGIGAALVAMK